MHASSVRTTSGSGGRAPFASLTAVKAIGGSWAALQGGTMFVVVADAAAARAVHLRNHARPPVLSFFTEGMLSALRSFYST